ncbi:hypothetical protein YASMINEVIRUS_521 [Yasminevirus sp. GU-2018]|uniref:Uncharacterized protein n=1 Tax=Yasminevirus sp. GU-2018 TaxID=2420051 RepID=A0A5K0U7T0_9VIRU|nr:hypothetical protein YASMINEVIRUS_521 [Yasminevirus sp. GU-2018]
MASVKNNFDTQVDSYLGFLKNEYAVAGISLFLILYAGVIAPKLPSNILKWFDNWIVQVALFFAIVYISQKNATVALITAVAVLVTLMVANNQITLKSATDAVTAEKFASCGCSSDDDSDDSQSVSRPEMKPEGEQEFDDHNAMEEIRTSRQEYRQESDVEGILDEHVEEHDVETAGMNHAVSGGATTSRGGPKMPSSMEPNFPSHRRHRRSRAETEAEHQSESESDSDSSESEMEQERPTKPSVTGVEDHHMDDESMGSSLDESKPMGSENGNADHSTVEHESAPTTAEEAVQNVVETVTTQVEQETGESVPEEVKESVMSEVATKVSNMAKKRPVGEYDVISVCREVYRRRL